MMLHNNIIQCAYKSIALWLIKIVHDLYRYLYIVKKNKPGKKIDGKIADINKSNVIKNRFKYNL